MKNITNFFKLLLLCLAMTQAYGMDLASILNNAQVLAALGIKAGESLADGLDKLADSPIGRAIGNTLDTVATKVGDMVDQQIKNMENEKDKRRREMETLRGGIEFASGRQKELLENRLEALIQADLEQDRIDAKRRQELEDLRKRGTEFGFKAAETGLNMLQTYQNGELEKTKAAIAADGQRQAVVEATQAVMANLFDPQNAKLAVATIGGSVLVTALAWKGSTFAFKMLDLMTEKVPTLAQETSLVSKAQKFKNYLLGVKTEDKVSDVILEPKLAARAARFAEAVKHTFENEAYFRHALFYGPPGTGKTMLAVRIARSCGMDYIYFAASSLDQFSLEEGLKQLTELFEFANNTSKPIVIVIDEAEMLLADRSKNLSEKSRKLLNHILTYTGTETRNFMVIALTNRPEDLDSAFLSRCDEQIEIPAPSVEQREQILQMYINKFLINPSEIIAQEPNVYARLYNKVTGAKKAKKPLIIKPGVFTKEEISAIAQRLENFVGRDIAKLVIAIESTVNATANRMVTKELVDEVVATKIAQKNQQLAGFGNKVAKGKNS